MVEKIMARPLVTIVNLIWSFNHTKHCPQILLVKRAQAPFKTWWALPDTLLRVNESADEACVRLIKDKIGLTLPLTATEQLATFTAPDRVVGERELALSYMTFLPSMPRLHPGYGAIAANWFTFDFKIDHYVLRYGDDVLSLPDAAKLAFDHREIVQTAITRIRNKLDYQPSILHILGDTFTLRQAREVYAPFLKTQAERIDNSNFKKNHQKFFEEVGTATRQHSGRPPKLFKLIS